MVEGPGCKLKGETLKKRVCGQTVKSVKSAVKLSKSSEKNTFEKVTNLQIEDVKTLGKELFILFSSSELCMRIHFLMNGSLRYNSVDLKKSSQKVELHLSTDVVHIFESCVDIRSSVECLARYDALHSVDICSPSFDFRQATELIRQRDDKMVCDAIMDQDALPGVGNIIKNESLFNSGIDPTKYVKQLTADQIARLLHRLRDFSAIFYKCRKENSALNRHYKVYGKQTCVECRGRLTVCKPGVLRRVTYYCTACQGGVGGKLPGAASGSLLGFFAPKTSDDCTWQCSACTLLNKVTAASCVVCLLPRTRPSPERINDAACSENIEPQTRTLDQNNKPSTKVQNTKVVSPEYICSGHNLPCIQKKVTKEGENRGRPFYVCRLPKQKQCVFFKWGDDHYPRCRHGKTTVLRSVLKVNSNNGKQFHCCPLPKNSQCDFFQWA